MSGIEYPAPVSAKAAVDEPITLSHPRASRASVIGTLTIAVSAVLIVVMVSAYVIGGAP